MKPPLFIECSVCGREFGSKSIQIHEPQCLQKLRRTEIAQQEAQETPPSTLKKTRRKKKTSERKLGNGTASSEMSRVPGATAIFGHSVNSAPSFVIMATTSTSNFASIERFNLPKIQSKTTGAGARPCTAVLDKPRILNPEYIQYDMSLTRIDFTGQSKSSTAIMDENHNSRIQRQNTQVIQNPASRRHGFALPNVLDSNLTVVGHQNHQQQPHHPKYQGKVFRSSEQSKLLPSGNMMTTADSILGDPQRKVRGDGRADMGLSFQSGKFWDDDAHHLPNTHTLMSLWSQEIYLMNALSSQLPALPLHPNTQIPLLPPLYESKFPNPSTTSTGTPSPSSTPSIESLFASPNFPFFGRLSQCDLEKPLRTCFHLDKIPGHRNEFEPQQDHFVTPSASAEFPQLPQPQPVDPSGPLNPATSTTDEPAADNSSAKQFAEAAGAGNSNYSQSNEISVLPLPADLINQQQERLSQESLIKFDSISNQLGTTAKEREQVETLIFHNDPQNNEPTQALNESELNTPRMAQQGRDPLNNWIGEPFMQQHAYYAAPFIKDHETDTESESYYATPMGESQDEHEPASVSSNTYDKFIMTAIQELKQFIDGKKNVELAQNQATFTMFPALLSDAVRQNTNVDGAMSSLPLEQPLNGTKMKLLASEIPKISYPHENSASLDYSQVETEVSDEIRTDSYEEGDGVPDYMREGSANSLKTIRSSSSCAKSITPERSRGRGRNQGLFSYRTGSDADDESCDSQSAEIPLRLSSTRLKSKTALTKRHQRLKRRSSSTKRNESLVLARDRKIAEDEAWKLREQTETEIESFNENLSPELKSDEDVSTFEPVESKFIPFKEEESNLAESDPEYENDFENPLPDRLFAESDSPEHSAQCGTSKSNNAPDDSELDTTRDITPLPSLESTLDNNFNNSDSSPGGSNQTVISKAKATPKVIFHHNTASGQQSVERIFFRATDVEPLLRRRPARTRPKTASCVEDTVTMWEGIQVNNSDQTLRNGLHFGEEIAFQNTPRPPTRRRSTTRSGEGQRLRKNLTFAASKADKKQTTKAFNAKIQNLISNVNRVGQLHREKLETEGKHFKDTKLSQRPQTSPTLNYEPQLLSWTGKTNRNRPSTSVPSSPADSSFQKSNGLTTKTKNPRSKRSLSQSATPRTEATSSSVTPRPMTATAVRFSTRSKPHSMTVRTTFVDSNNLRRPALEMYEKQKPEGRAPKRLPTNHSTDDEPLELLFSFKTNKPPSKRTLSPLGLAPQQKSHLDQASLYKHIELHRRQALSEAQKVLAKKRSLLRKIEKELTDTSTSAISSPLHSPRRVASSNNLHKSYNSTRPQPTKLLLKELSDQVTLEKTFELNRKLATKYEKIKSKSANSGSKTPEKGSVPVPMSKRVHFSSPIQTKLPRMKASVKASTKQLKTKSQQTSASSSRNNTPTMEDENQNQYSVSFHGPNIPQKMKVSVRKVPKSEVKKAQEGANEDEDPDRNDNGNASDHFPSNDLSRVSLGGMNPSDHGNDPNENVLERLEGVRDKYRGKEFERRKRGKGDRDRESRPIYSSVSMYLPRRKQNEKMVDLKIIVRRKNREGKFPSIDDAVGPLSSKCTYVIVDEEPLTRGGPNPYLEAQMKQAKPKGLAAPALKITTSEASTVDSLPSVEALNRFMTCYVCGKTLNVRDYFSHERKCVNNVNKNNVYLAEEDKRILPPKPQGTITIKHWNSFAHDATKDKLIRCPYCEMEFFPDSQEDVNFHKENCTNRPLPPVAPPRGLNITEHYTVQMAEEAQGWIVPTAKELHNNNWNPGYARVEQYTRPAENRLRKYKKPREQKR